MLQYKTNFFVHKGVLCINEVVGLRWQEVSFKDIFEEYRIRFLGEQRLVSAHISTYEPN
jgi:hypothetical protein